MSRLKRPKKPEDEFNLDEWTGGSSSLRGIDDAYRAFTTGPQLVEKKPAIPETSGDSIDASPDVFSASPDVLAEETAILAPSANTASASPDVLLSSPDGANPSTLKHLTSINTDASSMDRATTSPDVLLASHDQPSTSPDVLLVSHDQTNTSPDVLAAVDVFIAYTVQARPWVQAQDAHSPKEQDLYDEMWRNGKPLDEVSRTYSVAAPHTAERVRITPRNLIPLYERLVSKLTIELHKHEDRGRKTPKTWRVFSYKEINARRSRAGLTHVIRARNSVALVATPSPDTLTTSSVNLAPDGFGASPVNLRKTSRDNLSPPSYFKENYQFRKESPSTSSAFVVAAAIRESLGTVDDYAVRRILTECRRKAPDCTDEEIAHFARLSAHRIATMRNIDNPVGLLIVQVPKYFDGGALSHYREQEQQRRKKTEQAERELAEMAQQCLDDPKSSAEDIQWARAVLGKK